jgi:hypothetical protein
MTETPVRPVNMSFACVSVLTGVVPLTRTSASTWLGLSGASESLRTSPTWMPLYCTAPPTVRPVTASLNTIS